MSLRSMLRSALVIELARRFVQLGQAYFELLRDPRSGLIKAYDVNPSACNGCYACVNACLRQAIIIVLKR